MFPDSKYTYNIEEQIKKLKEQESKAKHFDDYCKLAEDISHGIILSQLSKDIENNDKYVKAFKAYCDSPDSAVIKKRFHDLGDYWGDEKALNNIDDLFETEWVSKIYQKAEGLAETYDEYRRLATSIEGYHEDDNMLLKIYKEVDRLAETFEEYECLAISIEDNLDDKKWVDKLRKKAEELKD